MIDEKIKEQYKSKAEFAESIGISPKDLSSRLRTLRNKINWINDFLHPLGLRVKIKASEGKKEEKGSTPETSDQQGNEQ